MASATSPTAAHAILHNDENVFVKSKRQVAQISQPTRVARKRTKASRIPLAPSSSSEATAQGIFDSAQDVTVEGGVFSNAGAGSVVINVHQRGPQRRPFDANVDHIALQSHDTGLNKPKAPAIPVPPKTDCQIYHDQLLYKGRGTPLWIPGPNLRLPKAYRREGVTIGDVGIINESGGFSFLFNVFEAKNSEINRGKVPDGFEPLQWINGSPSRLNTLGVDVDDVEEYAVYGDESWLGSRKITRIDVLSSPGFTFKIAGSEGAILTMPDGASSKDLVNRQALKDYMTSNLEEWYKYVNHQRGREAKNGDLRLVYGSDKVASWGIGTFRNDENTDPSTQETTMHFNAVGPQRHDGSGSPGRYAWKCAGGGTGRAGPAEREVKDLIFRPNQMAMDVDGDEGLHSKIENQCVFVRTLNAMLSEDVWVGITTGTRVATSESGESPEGELHRRNDLWDHNSGPANQGHRTASSSEAGSAPGGTFSDVQYMSSIGESPVSHPSSLLNQFLLKKHPRAKMVITEDADWITAYDAWFKNHDSETTRFDLPQAVRQTFKVLDSEGVLHILPLEIACLSANSPKKHSPRSWKGRYDHSTRSKPSKGPLTFSLHDQYLPCSGSTLDFHNSVKLQLPQGFRPSLTSVQTNGRQQDNELCIVDPSLFGMGDVHQLPMEEGLGSIIRS